MTRAPYAFPRPLAHALALSLPLALPLCACGDDTAAPPDAGTTDAGARADGSLPSDGGTTMRDGSPSEDGAGASDGGETVTPCTLTPSGAVVVDTPGAVVELLDITTDGEDALVVTADGVTVRDVHIRHHGGTGISVSNASDVVIQRVDIENTGAPATGAAASADENNIQTYRAPNITIRHARLTRGSTGIYLQESPGSVLNDIEGHDFRGPFPRGQLVQWNTSNDGLLDGFSVVNDAGSWTEDNVNVYHTTGATIRNGLVDGNNSPSGVGVIFDEMGSGLVEDVDAVHMGNGCFSTYAGLGGSVFRRTRCRDNICEDQGRGLPSSNALMWAGNPDGTLTRVEDSSYWSSCNGNISWPDTSFEVLELTEREFTARAPLDLAFCFE